MKSDRPVSGVSVATLFAAFTGSAVVLGFMVTRLEPQWVFAIALGGAGVALVFKDYRIGVILLTFLLPWFGSPLIPQTKGFNLINFLIVATTGSLLLHRYFTHGAAPLVHLPKLFWWCYLLPISIGFVIAWDYLPIGAANFPPLPTGDQLYAPATFAKTRFIKPLFFVVYAFLLANAVRDSRAPERFFAAFAVAACLPALGIAWAVLVGGGDVMARDSFLDDLGLHPNEYGMQLALAAGPLLFLAVSANASKDRIAFFGAFAIVSAGLFFTASRGAVLAYLVVLAYWLLVRRKFSDLLVAGLVAVILLLLAPESALERLTMGFDDLGATRASNMDDPLTKGRVASWFLLAPDVLKSPVWGQGVGSTAWNAATTMGRYGATHPHNLYLEVLLDLGVAGFLALAFLYYRYARGFHSLASAGATPMLRGYFRGALASFLGMLAMGFTNGHFMPHPEQAFLWFSLGFLFAFGGLRSTRPAPQTEARHDVYVRRWPAAQRHVR